MKKKSVGCDSLRIFGKEWLVKYMVPTFTDDMPYYGQAIFKDREIRICESSDTCERASTLIHEIIEVLNHDLELKLEHSQISALETGLFHTIVDNPSVLGLLNAAAIGGNK